MPHIKELGATFLIGSFFIAGLVLTFNWILDKRYFKKYFNAKGSQFDLKQISLWLAIPALALCYITGILLENTSDYIVGKDSDKTWVYETLMCGFPRDEDLKKEVLFIESEDYKLTALGKEVCKAHLFSRFGDNHKFQFFECIVLHHNSTCSRSIFKCLIPAEFWETAFRIYYNAKNKVYTEDNYFKELMDIQHRVDFIRSLALSSRLLLVATLIIYLILRLKLTNSTLVNKVKRLFPVSQDQTGEADDHDKGRSKPLNRIIVPFIILMVFIIFTCYTYKHEKKEFNKRVFGYYLSLVKSEKDKEGASKKTQITISTKQKNY